MLVQKARSVYWKKWAAKHEQEELKEGAWTDPALVLLRQKAKGVWTEKHRNVARRSSWKAVGTEKHGPYHCSEWHAVRRDILVSFRKWEQNARTSKKEWKGQRGTVAHPLSESQWNRGHFSVTKWESEKHRSWGVPAEGFKGHVAIDGCLLGSMWLGSGALGLR